MYRSRGQRRYEYESTYAHTSTRMFTRGIMTVFLSLVSMADYRFSKIDTVVDSAARRTSTPIYRNTRVERILEYPNTYTRYGVRYNIVVSRVRPTVLRDNPHGVIRSRPTGTYVIISLLL